MTSIFDPKAVKEKNEEELLKQMVNLVGGVDAPIFVERTEKNIFNIPNPMLYY